MKLTRIDYRSALFFGVLGLVLQFLLGLLQWAVRSELIASGVPFSTTQSLVVAPLVAGILMYLLTSLTIWVYNAISRKGYPISWSTSNESTTKKKK